MPTPVLILAALDRSDTALLMEHSRQCTLARGRLHPFYCAAEALDGLVAPRFVTTLAALTAVVAAASNLPPF